MSIRIKTLCGIALLFFVHTTLFGQYSELSPDSVKNDFLWFKGHWSTTKKNVFVIDSSSGTSGTVTVKGDGSLNIQTGDEKNWNRRLDDAVKDIEAMETKYIEGENQMQEIARNMHLLLKPELDTLKNNWQSLKVQPAKDEQVNPSNGLTNKAKTLEQDCQQWKPKYDAIINYYEAHHKDKDADLNNPPPPEFNYDCYSCDSNLRKFYFRKLSSYTHDFFLPESDLLRDAMSMLRSLVMVGRSDDIDGTAVNVSMDQQTAETIDKAFHKDKNDPSKSGSCAYLENWKLTNAIQFLAMRCLWRAKKLVRDNYKSKNYAAVEACIRVYCQALRDNCLLGFATDRGQDEYMIDLAVMVGEVYNQYKNKLLKEHDWSQLGNLPFIIGLLRSKAFLGESSEDESYVKLIDILNRFHLTIDMDIKVGGNGQYAIAHLKGESKVCPYFQQDSNRCYKWVLVEDKPDPANRPVKKAVQEIKCGVIANEIIGGGPTPVYIGTKNYLAMMKQLRMNFCNPGEDTIVLTGFRPDPIMGGVWQIPRAPNELLNINGLDQNFMDFDKMEELYQSGEAAAGAADEEKKAKMMMAQLQAMKASSGGKMDMKQIQKLQEMGSQITALGTDSRVAAMLQFDFPLEIKNKDNTLVKKVVNAQETNPKAASVISYGYYRVTIEFK
ncbi:MAG: hypothetical protein ACJ75B_22320 [Flavisolibacter sp.]